MSNETEYPTLSVFEIDGRWYYTDYWGKIINEDGMESEEWANKMLETFLDYH